MSSRPLFAPVQADARDSAQERRLRQERRAPRRTFDALFAATLVNQLAPAEASRPAAYQSAHAPRAGIAFDLSA